MAWQMVLREVISEEFAQRAGRGSTRQLRRVREALLWVCGDMEPHTQREALLHPMGGGVEDAGEEEWRTWDCYRRMQGPHHRPQARTRVPAYPLLHSSSACWSRSQLRFRFRFRFRFRCVARFRVDPLISVRTPHPPSTPWHCLSQA